MSNVLVRLLLLLTIMSAAVATCGVLAGAEQGAPLVRRDAARLTETGAQLAVDAAIAKAKQLQLKVNVAVVDEGGHLYRFARMEGARPLGVYTSQSKAASAVLFRAETGPLPSDNAADTRLSLAVENAARVGGGKFTSLNGGVPLVVEGQVVGAVGVGGASGEQDQEIARAAAKAFADALTKRALR